MSVRKAVFPVGGWGTRFLPITKAIPKAMLPIVDKPLVHYLVEEAVKSGIEQIVFTTSANNRAIEDYFTHSFELETLLDAKAKQGEDRDKEKTQELLCRVCAIADMAYFCSTQSAPRSTMHGLGVGVLQAWPIVGDEPFAVVLPNDLIDADIPCLRSLVSIYEALKCPVFAVHRVPADMMERYGNIAPLELDKAGLKHLGSGPYNPKRVYEVARLVQKPKKGQELSDLAVIGRFILNPDIFPVLEKIGQGYEGEVQLIDALQRLRGTGQKIYAYECDCAYYDTRSREGYVEAFLSYALRDPNLAAAIRNVMTGVGQKARPTCGGDNG